MSLHKFLGLASPPSKKQKNCGNKKRKRSFQSNWLNKFTWLEHKTDKMYCKVCHFFYSFQIHNKKKPQTFNLLYKKLVVIQKLNWSISTKIQLRKQDFASKFSWGGMPPPSQAIYMALVTRTTKILEGLGKFLDYQPLGLVY